MPTPQIHKATQMPEGELRRNLISLTTPRHRILRKASKQRGVADDDSFSFNADFQVRWGGWGGLRGCGVPISITPLTPPSC